MRARRRPKRARFRVWSSGHAQADFVQPSRHLRATFELFEPAINDDKDVLHGVGRVIFVDAEPAQHAPDEAKMLVVDRLELHRQWVAGCGARDHKIDHRAPSASTEATAAKRFSPRREITA